MRRQMDLIRALVLKIEDHESARAPEEIAVEGYSVAQVEYHKALLIEAGFAVGIPTEGLSDDDEPECFIERLTWDGHEFADSVRSDTVWNKVKVKVNEAAGSVPISVVAALAASYVKQKLGLP